MSGSGERAPSDPVVVPGADVVKVPELERPFLPTAVSRPELVDAGVVDQPALGQARRADLALRPVAEVTAEPFGNGRAEAHLLAVSDVVRDEVAIGHGLLQQPLADTVTNLHL